MQTRLPKGNTLLGIIGASDKTSLTFAAGGKPGKEMHPFLLSIANIEAGVRMKATSHAFALAAYLPIPKFCNVSNHTQSILAARVYHKCVDIVTEKLKMAANPDAAVPMSNPWGGLNTVNTPLVSWIADYPEQLMIACVAAKQSPITTASAQQFGDVYPHSPRTREITINAITAACHETDPWDISQFYNTCQKHHLNGVYQPFWRDWGLAEPSLFLTPDALHQWHIFAYDHILKWVINIMGGDELDHRLMVLQPRIGSRQWPQGVSTLKQCTGRDHRALEALIVAVAAGAVPDQVLCAIRSLIEFIFQAQDLYHYEETFRSLQNALQQFHLNKQSIIDAGGRKGKSGVIPHFEIPKLELMQSVARSIRAMGAAYQWTSDITERCHITLVKRPYRLSSPRDFHLQCCRYLDREEKIRLFSLYTTIKTGGASLLNEMRREAGEMAAHYPESQWISQVLPDEHPVPKCGPPSNLFRRAHSCISADETTAFLLTRAPHLPNISIEDASVSFMLPDLRPALCDLFSGRGYATRYGGCRPGFALDCALPFTHINVWRNLRLQRCSAQDQRVLMPAQTVQALQPSDEMPHGRYHTVAVNFPSNNVGVLSQSQDEGKYPLCFL